MKRIAKIRFQKKGTILDYDARDLDLEIGDKVMVEWEDALKMGTVTEIKESDSSIPSSIRAKVTSENLWDNIPKYRFANNSTIASFISSRSISTVHSPVFFIE